MSDQLSADSAEPQEYHSPNDLPADKPKQAQEQKSQQFDPAYMEKIESRLNELGTNFQTFMEQFQQPADPEADLDAYGAEEDYAPEDVDEDDPEYENHRLRQLLEEAVETRLKPLEQERMIDKRNDAFDSFLAEYPELQDPEKHSPIVQQAYEFAVQMNPEVVDSPLFVKIIEQTYKAMKADERAAQETPAGQRQDVHIEAGGRVAPDGSGEDEQDRLMKVWSRPQGGSF